MKRDPRLPKDVHLGSKRLTSPSRLKSHMQTTRLESSQRWKVFLSDDADFRRFLSGPLKIMTRNFRRLHDFKALQRSLSRWKEVVNVDSKEERIPLRSEPIQSGGTSNFNPYEQEFMWEDPHFNPYEGVDEEEEPVVEKDDLDGVTDMEVYNAADGRPLDVDELRAPFPSVPEDPSPSVHPPNTSSSSVLNDNMNEPWRGMVPSRPRFNFSDDRDSSSLPPQLTAVANPQASQPSTISVAPSVRSVAITRPTTLAFNPQLSSETALWSAVPPAISDNNSSSSSSVSLSKGYSDLGQVPWPTRQYSYPSSTSVYDDADGMDDGFELPP